MLALPPSTTAQASAPSVTVMVLPDRVEPEDLAGIDDAAVGLLSGGIGNVPAAQTYLDITQGARLNSSLYDGDVPLLLVEPPGRIDPRQWQRASERAADAPSDLVPGLLATTLADAGIPAGALPDARNAALLVADREGRIASAPRPCALGGCPGLTVTAGEVDDAERIAAGLAPGDLLIAFERPPAEDDRQLALAVAGLGPGVPVSDSTRIDGYVLSTDLAPTILERLGADVPDEVAGRAIRAVQRADAVTHVQGLDDRMAAISPRRGEAVGITLLIWVALVAAAAAATRGRALRPGLRLLAVSVAYLPAVLLLCAGLEPSESAERMIAGALPPLLALATLRMVPGWGAFAVACAVSVGTHVLDVVAGSPLTSFSLLGPNPALGVRFYGIGNELEASLVALLLVGAGAALTAWAAGASPRARATVFALVALVGVATLAPGRFGADVGAAIGIPAGAAVAVAVVLHAGGRRAIVILAAVPAALLLVALLDLVLGGDAHLSRSVLEAGGLDEVGQVAERRLRLCAESFARYADSPVLWATIALIAGGIWRRRAVLAWFDGAPAARAGFLGAAAATLVGTVANDSGAMLLMIGTAVTSLAAGFAWSAQARRQREV